MSDEIDELMSELKETKKLGNFLQRKERPPETSPEITEENIGEFVMNNAARLIQQSVNTMEDVKDSVIDGGTPDEVSAYADLVRATTSAIDILNRINLQNKRAKTAKEIKEMDLAGRKQIENNKKGDTYNVLVAPREEIMKKIFKDSEAKDAIDIKFQEVDE